MKTFEFLEKRWEYIKRRYEQLDFECSSVFRELFSLLEIMSKITWRRAKAGTHFGKDTIVMYDNAPDVQLARYAVFDCFYIHVEDLKDLPKDGEAELNDNY